MSHGGDAPITCIHCQKVIKTYRRITGETVVNCDCGETDILGFKPGERDDNLLFTMPDKAAKPSTDPL